MPKASEAEASFARSTVEPVLALHGVLRDESASQGQLLAIRQHFEGLLTSLGSLKPTEGEPIAALGATLAEYSAFVRRIAPLDGNARRQFAPELVPIDARWQEAMRGVERATKTPILSQFDLSLLGQVPGAATSTTLPPPNLNRTTTTVPKPPPGLSSTTSAVPPPPSS